MSTRTRLAPYKVITAGSMAGSLVSQVTTLQTITHVGYFLTWTGTAPVGTASVQVSYDYSANPSSNVVANAGTWNTLTLDVGGTPSQTITISGATGTASVDLVTAAPYIRLIYTFTSGTGTVTAWISGKVA